MEEERRVGRHALDPEQDCPPPGAAQSCFGFGSAPASRSRRAPSDHGHPRPRPRPNWAVIHVSDSMSDGPIQNRVRVNSGGRPSRVARPSLQHLRLKFVPSASRRRARRVDTTYSDCRRLTIGWPLAIPRASATFWRRGVLVCWSCEGRNDDTAAACASCGEQLDFHDYVLDSTSDDFLQRHLDRRRRARAAQARPVTASVNEELRTQSEGSRLFVEQVQAATKHDRGLGLMRRALRRTVNSIFRGTRQEDAIANGGQRASTIADIKVYGAPWCSHSRRTKKFLDEQRVPYDWIDIDEDAEALRFVKELQDGGSTIPTVLFPDGSHLLEPSNDKLAHKLDSSSRPNSHSMT